MKISCKELSKHFWERKRYVVRVERGTAYWLIPWKKGIKNYDLCQLFREVNNALERLQKI